MSKVKIALELDLKQADQCTLYGLIGQYLSGQPAQTATEAPKAAPAATKAAAPAKATPKPAEAPEPEAAAPTVTMVDLVAKAQALVAVEGATYGQQLRAWMNERGHVGRVPELPKALWDEFNAFLDSLSV